MSVEIAHGVGPAHLDIAYEPFGEPGLPPVQRGSLVDRMR